MRPKRRSTGSSRPRPQLLDDAGWVAILGVLSRAEARWLGEQCSSALASSAAEVRVGNKQASGTRRLVDLPDRIPGVQAAVEHPSVAAAVAWLLGEGDKVTAVTFRSPQPGFGWPQPSWRCVTSPSTTGPRP